MGRVVLVTGVSGDLGARFARHLAGSPGVDKVVGLDVHPPSVDLAGVKYVRADIRTPVVGKVLAVEEVDTVVHLGVTPAVRGSGSAKEVNVIGSMQLLAACQRAPGVERFVLRSSGAVYGASARDVAMFDETMGPRGGVGPGYAKDCVEVEGYVRGFGRRRPDVAVTTLRMAYVLSPRIDTALSSYLRLPVLPAVLGFDPRLQLLGEHDALEVLRLATVDERPGTFNVAGDGVMMLTQVARRLGRPLARVPSPTFRTVAGSLGRPFGVAGVAGLQPYLTYGRGLDVTMLRTEFGYDPRDTTRDVVDAFAATVEPGALHHLTGAARA